MQKQVTSEEMTPIDEIISRVEEYIKNPKMVTSETLQALKDDLLDLKPMLDGDEREGMGEMDEGMKGGHGKPSLVIAIGGMKKKERGER